MIRRKEVIGDATLFLGDAYEIAPTLGAFDILFSDPQYEFDTSGGGKFRKDRAYLDDIQEQGLNKGFDHAIINTLLYRSVVLFCHNEQLPELSLYLKGSFHRFCVMAWHKRNPMPVANKHYVPDTEFFIHAWNKGGHPEGDLAALSRYVLTNNGKSPLPHPSVKPISVMDKVMRVLRGHTVLDPFMGTGSTGVSAVAFGKSFTGIEINEKHFDLACRRIENAYRDPVRRLSDAELAVVGSRKFHELSPAEQEAFNAAMTAAKNVPDVWTEQAGGA